jgi:hypothetical protein
MSLYTAAQLVFIDEVGKESKAARRKMATPPCGSSR